MKEITEEMFKTVEALYPPNKFTKFMFRHFSTNTAKEDLHVRRVVQGILIATFALGFLGTVIGVTNLFIMFVTLSFTLGLVLLGIAMTTAVIMNNLRIRKIRKHLGLSRSSYDDLKYYWD